MCQKLYLPRTLTYDEQSYSEASLLTASSHIVVLAEPGGGKTELLNSIARQLGGAVVTANVFGQLGANATNSPLIIDAFDELAKVDKTGIHKLLGNAQKANPTTVVIASRSSEWDNAATFSFTDFLGHTPLVVRIREFDEAEQELIFEHHTPGEDFTLFKGEVARFDLDVLLPNPQFLKLFADAYIESGRHFTDKRSIFERAVERLAKEANAKIASTRQPLPITRKVQIVSEVSAKLLLSGAEGICTSETGETRMYPLFATLLEMDDGVNAILATRLFKPGDDADHHRPVHKIVSEYCAANYIVKRIADVSDPLTLSKCLPIIAPNSTVRDELRGMLGWMASLGNVTIQEAAIDLDAYAVLANGDPSQLEPSSKLRLVNCLSNIADQDPYFRRGDFWRRFSVAGFFTQEVVDAIKPLLNQKNDGHLRNLILELLDGSPVIDELTTVLRELVLSPEAGEHTRLLAIRCLLGDDCYERYADLAILIFEASQTSLKVAAKVIETLGPDTLDKAFLLGFFRVSANLYPGRRKRFQRTISGRYYLKHFVKCFDTGTIEWLLDNLTNGIFCICGNKPFKCDCRNGISKIIGSMLDRYFELATPPYDPERIWRWISNLHYSQHKSAEESKAVHVLKNNDTLRQGIIEYVFGTLTDHDQILDTRINKFGWYSNSGLSFQDDDYRFIVDLGFKNDNPDLWACFIADHQLHHDNANSGPNILRQHMRKQALIKPAFMKEWAKSNRATVRLQQGLQVPNYRLTRKMKRDQTQLKENRLANIKYVHDNRKLVEGGRHWACLTRFADLVLSDPDKIEHEFGDQTIVRNALRNCLDYIAPHVPDLHALAKLQCASKYNQTETILYAACLEILRSDGTLEAVEKSLLAALKTNLEMHFDAVNDEEREALQSEVDRLLFPTIEDAEIFCRQYLEPQLVVSSCKNPQVSWLKYDSMFTSLGPTLSIEWLGSFKNMSLSAEEELFDIAAQHGNREQLNEIIASRCNTLMFSWPPLNDCEELKAKRNFWFIRALYFLGDPLAFYWVWLKSDRNTVLLLDEISGAMNRSNTPFWPILTAPMIEAILDAFIDTWPKVNLPSSWGTSSPPGENAYRFLTGVIWSIDSDDSDGVLAVLDRLIADTRYVDLQNNLMSIRAGQIRKRALRDFEPPTPQEIVNFLDHGAVVSVEGLRQLVIQELLDFQKEIDGGEFNSATVFYEKKERIDENRSTERIAERLNLRLQPQNVSITPEHQLKDAKRSDFTAAKMICGKRRLLVTEVKGQWHTELYTAAKAQLHARYSIHQDAEQQGVYLVLWFGSGEKVAGKIRHDIESAQELKMHIEMQMPKELLSLISVFVLDVSIT